MHPMQPESLLTRQEVAEILKTTKQHVADLTSRGAIRATKLGHRTLRYRGVDVQEFIERAARDTQHSN